MNKRRQAKVSPTPEHMAEIACSGRTIGQGYQNGFEHGVALERARLMSTRAPQWVQMGESTWVAIWGNGHYRAWVRPMDSGPDGGQITVTEMGIGRPAQRIVIDAPSWEDASAAVVAHAGVKP